MLIPIGACVRDCQFATYVFAKYAGMLSDPFRLVRKRPDYFGMVALFTVLPLRCAARYKGSHGHSAGEAFPRPMRDKTTSFDIAERAGVSQPTVSRALRGDPTVSEGTRKRIEAIARQLNYQVDKNASSLRRGQSRTLALLFFQDPTPDESMINPFFLSMLGSILRTCALRGYDLLTSFQQLQSNWHVEYEDSRKADGIILLGYG